MLEHVPQFRLEKTISEFNRIMKIGGTIRILVPNLKLTAKAYVNNDYSFFSTSKKYSNHMGIGASFLRKILSPGTNSIVISREMDEIIGSYGHLFAFDFEMLKMVLEKWGFKNIVESKIGKSSIKEIAATNQHLVCGKKKYEIKDKFVKEKKYEKSNEEFYFTGFDKITKNQLIVEAKKSKDVAYSHQNEYPIYSAKNFQSPPDLVKLLLIKIISKSIDNLFNLLSFLKITKAIKVIYNIKVKVFSAQKRL